MCIELVYSSETGIVNQVTGRVVCCQRCFWKRYKNVGREGNRSHVAAILNSNESLK